VKLDNLVKVRSEHNPCDIGTRPEEVKIESVSLLQEKLDEQSLVKILAKSAILLVITRFNVLTK
jgi:hypothetical protein